MPHNRTRNRRSLFVKRTAAFLFAASLLSGCSLLPQEATTLQPPLVKPAQEKFDTVEVKKGVIERFFSGVGIAASSRNQPLFYKDNGRLKEIYVSSGDQVKAGQLVAELDTGDLDMRINLQKLSVERAKIELDRTKQAGADRRDIRIREIDLERERLTLDALEKQFAAARILAPFNGVVSYVDSIQPGDGVTGYKPIVNIADPTQLYLVYEAEDPKTISAVQFGMPVEIKVDEEMLKGSVIQSPSSAPFTDNKELADRNAKMLYVAVDGKSDKLTLGSSADIKIMLEKRDNVIVLPRSGLRSYLGRTYVQVLDGDRRKEVDVEPGIMTQTQVEIIKGLEPGQQVILNN